MAFYRALEVPAGATADELEQLKDNHLRPVLDAVTTVAIEAAEYDATGLILPARAAFYRVYERALDHRFQAAPGWIWTTCGRGVRC